MSFKQDWYSPPGDTIEAVLRERKISISEFARQINESPQFAKELIAGDQPIDESLAKRLELTLGSTASFWIRRERGYRLDKARVMKDRNGKEAKEDNNTRQPTRHQT